MSKRKKRGTCSTYEGYQTFIAVNDRARYEALKTAHREMEEDSFNIGADDRNNNRKAMPYIEFALDFAELTLPPAIKAEIVRANYATYLDGYKGKEFKAHIICEFI